jgi:hypothetical protein
MLCAYRSPCTTPRACRCATALATVSATRSSTDALHLKARGVHVAGTTAQAGRPGQVDKIGRDEGQQQTTQPIGVINQLGHGCAQRRVLAGGQASGQFVLGQAVAGDRAFEQLECPGDAIALPRRHRSHGHIPPHDERGRCDRMHPRPASRPPSTRPKALRSTVRSLVRQHPMPSPAGCPIPPATPARATRSASRAAG